MIRDTNTLLVYEAKRKPIIQHLIDNITSVSVEEIEGQTFMPWIKKALKEIREQKLATMRVDSVMELLPNSVEFSPDPMGLMYRWTGPDTFIHIDRNGQIELRNNKLFWFPKTGGVWLDTVFSQNVDPRLLANSTFIKEISKSGYSQQYNAELNQNCPIDAPVIMGHTKDVGPLTTLQAVHGVRISRV